MNAYIDRNGVLKVGVISLLLLILSVHWNSVQAGWASKGAVGASGYALWKTTDENLDILGKTLSAAIKSDRAEVERLSNEIESTGWRLASRAAPVLGIPAAIAKKAVAAKERIRSFSSDLKTELKNKTANVRALALDEGNDSDGWNEQSSLKLHTPIEKPGKVALLQQDEPSDRHTKQSVQIINEGLYGTTEQPILLSDYEKYRQTAIENWNKNVSAKQQWLQKNMGVGAKVLNLNEWQESKKQQNNAVNLQKKEDPLSVQCSDTQYNCPSGDGKKQKNSYIAALQSTFEVGNYQAALQSLDEKERQRRKVEKRQAEMEKKAKQATVSPDCKEYIAAVKYFFKIQGKYAHAQYDDREFDHSFVQKAYSKLRSAARSVEVDFDSALSASQSVWYETAEGSSVAEAKAKVGPAVEASMNAFIKHGEACVG